MKTRIAAFATALMIGVAPISSAMAFDTGIRYAPNTYYDVESTGSIGYEDARPSYLGCPMSSAAEGNANQQNFPVKQYGQTAGGTRC